MNLIEVFEETLHTCQTDGQLRKAIDKSVEAQTVIFENETVPETPPRFPEPVRCVLSSRRSFEAARPYALAEKKICVLNFASFVTPGGGVLYGSRAQEESLCRASTLYPALTGETAKPFYEAHWKTINAGKPDRKNTDDCIYTPSVVVIREDALDGNLLSKDARYTVDVITCAAPDQRWTDAGQYSPTEEELLEVMKRRIRRILAVAALHEADVLILGAFGCGAFFNPPAVVARAFEETVPEFAYHFETIEYAVAANRGPSENYAAFAEIKGIIVK